MRLRRGRGLLLGVFAVGAAACGPDYPPTSEGLYMAKCSRCHEADGSSITASEQADRHVDLRDDFFQRHHTDAELRRIMQYGQDRMQGVPGLSDAKLDSIVLHVRRLGGRPTWILDSDPAAD